MKSSDWLPMESAPLNPYGKAFGPMVLIWCSAGNEPVSAWYEPSGGTDNGPRWVMLNGDVLADGDALAWMPIAAPWQVLDREADSKPLEAKCQFCGWSAAGDRHRAALKLVTHDELARLHRRIKNMRKSPMPDEIVFANLCAEGWDRDAVAKAMEAK